MKSGKLCSLLSKSDCSKMEDVPSPTVLTPFFLQFRLTPADDEWTHNGSIQNLHKFFANSNELPGHTTFDFSSVLGKLP